MSTPSLGMVFRPKLPPERLRSVALSGELADGTLLTGGTTPDTLRRTRGRLDDARPAAGASGPHTVTVYLVAASGPRAEQRLAAELQAWSLDPNEDVGIAGGPEQLAEGISRWVAAGADSVVLQPAAVEPDLEAFIALLGEVRSLLGS